MPRRTTVHDAAALKVHPDGTRVRSGKRNATRDAVGNVVATDGAGLANVRKRRRKPEDDGEDIDLEGLEADDLNGLRTEKEKKALKDPRARKRRKFNDDLDFLQPSAPSISSEEPPLPSSDLLKTIHHFAARYYAARGQLSDLTAEARRRRKAKRLRLLREKIRAEHGEEVLQELDERVENEIDGEQKEGARRETSDDEDEREGARDDDFRPSDEDDAESQARSEPPDGGAAKSKLQKDLYKGFDGSALMAIGILLQEHIRHTIVAHVEEGHFEQESSRGASTANDSDGDGRNVGRAELAEDESGEGDSIDDE